MKVLFSLTYYFPYSSGLTLYVKRLGEALVKKNYKVTVLTMNFDKKCRPEEIVNRVKVVRAQPIFKVSKGFISVDWIIRSFSEVRKNDLVVVNLPQFEGIVPTLFGKIFGKKVISIYHCEVVLPSGIINSIIQKILSISNLFSLLLSDVVVTYTKDFAKSSQVLPHFESKLKYIYPPIKTPKINKRVQKILMDKITPWPNFVIGVAARLAAEKGIEYLLESIPAINSTLNQSKHNSGLPRTVLRSGTGAKFKIAQRAPDSKLQLKSQKQESAEDTSGVLRSDFPDGGGIRIVIAGPKDPVGEKDYKKKILKLVEKYKDFVIFLGELKEKEMGSFYSLLDILVLPSINSTEAFGMVQVEAMIMGVPVMATDLPGVRIPIQRTGMGLLAPIKNSQKLAKAIVEVLINKKKYIKPRELIKREFSFEKTINFYENLLKR